VQDMFVQTKAIAANAKAAGLSRQTIYRIKEDPAAAETSLAAWDARPFGSAA
jgi:hypothetical protein